MAFTGSIVELNIGLDGFTGTKNLAEITPQNLIKALNISFADGSIRKEGGASKYNSSAVSSEVLAGWDWWPDENNQRMVILTGDGDLKKDSGTGTFATTLKSGLSITGSVPVFVEGGKEAAASDRKLFIFTGLNPVQVLADDDATTADLATPPADWSSVNQPTFGFIHEGRLMGGGNNNDPHRIYYSLASDHEDFTTSGSGTISIYPGEGEKLVGGMSFKGLAVLWKYPKGIYAIDTSDPTPANWRVTKISREIGGSSPRCFCMIDDDIIFADAHANLHLISTITEFGNLGSRNISQLAGIDTFLKDEINFQSLLGIRTIYYTARREVHILLPSSGQTTLNRRLTVDLNRVDFPRFRWNERDVNNDIWLRRNDTDGKTRPTICDNDGFVWELDQDVKSKEGGYISSFQTPHLDLGFVDPKLGTVRKNGKFLELVVAPQGNWSLFADIYWDGVYTQTVQFNMGQVGASLDNFTLDSDVLSVDQIMNRKRRITGSGRRISVEFYNDGDNQDFSVSKAYLHFKPGSEKHD